MALDPLPQKKFNALATFPIGEGGGKKFSSEGVRGSLETPFEKDYYR